MNISDELMIGILFMYLRQNILTLETLHMINRYFNLINYRIEHFHYNLFRNIIIAIEHSKMYINY